MNMHHPPAAGSFCDKHITFLKAAIVKNCDRYMGYVKKSDCLMNTYFDGRQTWKLTKKIFFPNQMHLSNLNSSVILTIYVSILLYQNFRYAFLRDLIKHKGKTTPQGRQILSLANQPTLTYNMVNFGPQKERSSVLYMFCEK
jgi:hypothetical protein